MNEIKQIAEVRQENREFLEHFSASVRLPYAFMGYFHMDTMTFAEFWMGSRPESKIERPCEFASSLERRVAGYLKVNQIFSDAVASKVRRMQKEKNLWITSGDECIGIGEAMGKLVPIIAFPQDDHNTAPERQAIFKMGLTYVVQALNKKLFMNSDWHEDIFKAALPILSVEFVVLNKRGEIVHDARQGETWQDMLPDAQHEPTEEPAFLKDTSRAEFHNAVVAAASPEGKTTLVPVFGEEDTPQMVLVTPMGGSDLGLALVIFEGGQTDHTWWLGQLFDIYKLTPSERQVARGIIFGQTVTEIASDADWSVATVRSYVKQVLSKMGLHRQSELITLYHSSKLPIAKTQSLHGKPGYRT